MDILDRYDQVRRDIFYAVTDPISTANLERVRKDVGSVVHAQDPFFALLDAAKKDPRIYEQLLRVRISLLNMYK